MSKLGSSQIPSSFVPCENGPWFQIPEDFSDAPVGHLIQYHEGRLLKSLDGKEQSHCC